MYENILSNMLGCQTYCISDSPSNRYCLIGPIECNEKLIKAVIKERNKGLSPEYDKEYYCGTCGAKDGAEHPKTGYCFHCDTDNWIPKND